MFDPYVRALYILAFLLLITWVVSKCGKSRDTGLEKATPADIALTKAAIIGSNVVQTIKNIATSPAETVEFHSTSFDAEGDTVNQLVIGKADPSQQLIPSPKSNAGLLDIKQLLIDPPLQSKGHITTLSNGSSIQRIVDFLQQAEVEAPQTFILQGLDFQSGSIELTPSSLKLVDSLATVISAYETMRVRLDGHTDNVGEAETNKELSAARAKSVMDALISSGANAQQLSSRGFGEERPISENASPEGQRTNRRVEIIVLHK